MSSRLSPVAAIQAEAQKAAKELEVDDFVDTYLRERPKTRNPFDAPRPNEESGIRVALAHRAGNEVRRPTVEVEAVAVAGADGEVVALEAELAEREERIESLEQELKRLRDSVTDEAERASRAEPPVPIAPAVVALPASATVVAERAPTDEVRPPPAAAAPPVPAPRARSAPGPSRLRPVVGIALLVGAAISLVVGVGRLASDGSPDVAPSADPTASAARVATAEPEPPAPPSVPTTEAVPPPAAVPSAAVPAATDTPAEPEDAPGLLSFQGHLTVASSVDAEVVIQGQPAGRTNQRLLTRCGPRNVRLRDGTTWITEGEHVRIVCMKHTSIRLDPSGRRP